MAFYDDYQHQTSLAEIRGRLLKNKNLITRASGAFHLSDDSFPQETSHRQKSWRCLPMTRSGLVLSGRHEMAFVRKTATIEALLRPGDMWLYPPDTHDDEMFLHRCQYISAVFFDGYTRFVIVNNEGPRGPGENYPSPVWFHWHEERPAEVKSTLDALLGIFRRDSSTRATACLCRALWLLLLEWLCSSEQTPPSPPLRKAAATWMAVERMIQETYHRPIDRQTVADHLQLHPNRISELCREFAGDTFQHILEKRRLRQAKRFLENSNTKIEAIAVMCGFSGATYFTRAFGRATGMSPGAWRRKYSQTPRS